MGNAITVCLSYAQKMGSVAVLIDQSAALAGFGGSALLRRHRPGEEGESGRCGLPAS